MNVWWSEPELFELISGCYPDMSRATFDQITLDLIQDGVLQVVDDGYSPSTIGMALSKMGRGGGH